MIEREPWLFVTLGEAATAAVDASARAFASDQRDLPADADDASLWGDGSCRFDDDLECYKEC